MWGPTIAATRPHSKTRGGGTRKALMGRLSLCVQTPQPPWTAPPRTSNSPLNPREERSPDDMREGPNPPAPPHPHWHWRRRGLSGHAMPPPLR